MQVGLILVDKKEDHHVEVWTAQSSKTFWEQSCAQSRKKSWLCVSAHKYTLYDDDDDDGGDDDDDDDDPSF